MGRRLFRLFGAQCRGDRRASNSADRQKRGEEPGSKHYSQQHSDGEDRQPTAAIEPSGEEEVYDLTVPGPASWLADGIVSHNSGALEQDADLILFLYRPSIYKEDLPPDEANITEVIIGKQRNGPVGTVKVVFLPQYARFENIADLHRAPQPF